MKKGFKRGFAAFIALLMLGCQILPGIGTIASGSSADETKQDAYVKYDFDDMDLSTMTEATSTMFEKNKNVTVSGEVDQAVSKHWWTGTTYNSQVSPANRKNNGIKPKNHDTNTYRLDLTEGSENFELTTKIYYKDGYGIAFGKKNVFPDANGSYGAAYVNFGPITNGAIDLKGFATLSETGADSTLSGTRVTVDKLKQNSSTNNVGGCLLTLHIKVIGNKVEVWLDEYDVKIQGTLSDSYEVGTISLTAKEYKGGGGFKSIEIMKYDVAYDFDNMDLSTMTEATSTMFEKNKNVTVSGEVDQAVSKHWWTGTTYNSQVSPANRKNNGIKPKNHDTNTYRLDLTEGSENFELTTKIYYKDGYGIAFGKKNVFPDANGSYGAAYVNFGPITNGAIDLKGFATLSETGADSTLSGTRVTVDKLKQNSSTNNVGGCLLTLHIKVIGNKVEVWLDEYDVKIQGTLSDSYEVGTISLTAKEYKGGGGFKAIWMKDWTPEQEVEIPATPAVVGDSFEKDFTGLSAVTGLDEEFNSYYFESNTATGTKGKPSEQWAIGTGVYTSSTPSALRNNWLKPTHRSDGKKHTLLTYKSKIFTNVEVEAEYVTNHVRYGVMIAPEGQLSTAQNGVRVYVDGSGLIKIEGAIDAGTATATGGYVYVGGKNILSGYAIPDYVKASSSASNASNCTSYTIHIRITGKIMQVWLNECPTYVISVQLTEAYTGGMVSLYSTGNDHGAFKSFKAIENEGATSVEDSSVFTQSFNTISSTDELKDKFDAYTLGASKTEAPAAANIENIYRVADGMLKSNLTKAGTDYSDFGILTLKNKRYENFELTLKYVQDPNRYAVMIGTEPGEFAFSGDASHVNGNGGVLVYTEMEGYRNIKGSLYASSYTNAKIAVHKKTDNPKLESFVAFKSTSADKSDVLATLEKKPLHTMTIRVVDGYLTMIVDNNEKSRVTVRLADYDGGYISLVTNVNKNLSTSYGGVVSLAVKELGDDAELNTTLPETGEEFETIKQVEKLFDAYYLEN